ncbi:MAG: hypothetical protein H6714_08580 [Myxococcales bacterium]|nr:hypothetical protein [Myxococcales bacterium]
MDFPRSYRLTLAILVLAALAVAGSGSLAHAQQPPSPAPHIQKKACLLGTHNGIEQPDAETVTALICAQLRSAGVSVEGPYFETVEASELYVVELRRLGSSIILSLSHESPRGTLRTSRTLELSRIEEARLGAPRVVRALVHHEPIQETRTGENLLSVETTQPQRIQSEFFFGLGLGAAVGIGAPGFSEGYGVEIILQHQNPHWAIGGTARILGGELVVANLNLGGRYFFLDNDLSPFLGTSLGLYALDSSHDSNGGGLGAQLELGMEFMRFHSSRLGAAIQIDFPFFATTGYESGTDAYTVPIGVFVYYLF